MLVCLSFNKNGVLVNFRTCGMASRLEIGHWGFELWFRFS